MAPGPKPKPSWLKVVTGNPGHRPINEDEPVPVGDIVEPPPWFDDKQRAEWSAAIDAAPAGLLKQLDKSMLVVWVCAKVLHAEAVQKVTQFGALIKTPVTGAPMQSPYVSIMNRQAALMMRAAAEMGFSPSSRSRVSIAQKRKGKAETPFDDLKELPT
jgi:P27 family predicted phage terminase small subunit